MSGNNAAPADWQISQGQNTEHDTLYVKHKSNARLGGVLPSRYATKLTLVDTFDMVRLDYLAECADLIAARADALTVACYNYDLRLADILFDCIRLIGRDYARTRAEIKTKEVSK